MHYSLTIHARILFREVPFRDCLKVLVFVCGLEFFVPTLNYFLLIFGAWNMRQTFMQLILANVVTVITISPFKCYSCADFFVFFWHKYDI